MDNKFIKKGMYLLVLMLVLVLAACGGEDKDSSTATDNGDTGKDNEQTTVSDYKPSSSVTLVAPSNAGGSWDIAARSIANVILSEKIIDHQLLVENVPGGSGAVFMADYATKEVKNDNLLMVNAPSLIINNVRSEGNSPFGYQDTTPLAQLFRDYGVIAVRSDSEFKDLKTLMEAVRANPEKFSVGGGSATGAMWHLNFALPANALGLDITKIKYVPFGGNGEAITNLLGGHVEILSSGASDVVEFVKSGDVRILAIDAPKRLEGPLADVPTLKELNIDAEFNIWRGVFGPKDMSEEARVYWENKLEELANNPKWAEELANRGWEADFRKGEEFTKALEAQQKDIHTILSLLGLAN